MRIFIPYSNKKDSELEPSSQKKHIEFERNKMKCSLAAQTLSSSVAAAIDFCREDLILPEFQHSEATTELIHQAI